AITVWDRLVNQEGRRELANLLSTVYYNKAGAVSALGDHRGAMTLYDQALAIWERLVNQEGRRELANDLAMGYTNKAISVSALGDHREAVALYDQSIAIMLRLVKQEGRSDLSSAVMITELYRAGSLQVISTLSSTECRRAQAAFAGVSAESERAGSAHLQNVMIWAQANLDGII
ncbi:MAG: tetratricopeptide repeat protein, partial [Kiritimatiellia bacterium]